MTSTAAAPSEYGEALPAVTVPVGRNAGRSLPSPSSVVSARGHSSVSNTTSVTDFSAPFHVYFCVWMGTISSRNAPPATAAAAFC